MKKRKGTTQTVRTSSRPKSHRPDPERLGDIFRSVVGDQLQANDPPEVASTLRRLVATGLDETEAVELICAVVAAEMFDMMTEGREFNLQRYIRHLRNLPELPPDNDA